VSEFRPIDNVVDLCWLNQIEVEYGYLAGLAGAAEPVASTFSRSVWHGWRNGMVDGDHALQDEYQERLAYAYSKPQWEH
jgi:ribosome modulation factor